MIILDYNAKETVGELWQYDYGETLRIQGGSLQKAQEVHFSLTGTGGDSITRIGVTKDNATDVVIPDSMLENNDSEIDYLIYVFLYNRDSTSGETTKRFVLNVRSRPKPEHTGGTDGNAFGEVIEEVNKSAERAEVAERKAKEYATQTKEDAQNTADDRKEVERLVESVSDIDEKVQKVNEYKEQAQTSATKALLSEQESKKAEQSALQAQAGAETAENSAEQHATQVRGDKAYVEQTAQNFALKAQQTLTDVNNAGQTQVEHIQQTGENAVESVNTAQNTAIKGIETAKTEAVKTVQTEGTKQVQAVQEKGNEVLQSIPPNFVTQMQGKLDKQQGVDNAGKALVVGQDGNVVLMANGNNTSCGGFELIRTFTVPKDPKQINDGITWITDDAVDKIQGFIIDKNDVGQSFLCQDVIIAFDGNAVGGGETNIELGYSLKPGEFISSYKCGFKENGYNQLFALNRIGKNLSLPYGVQGTLYSANPNIRWSFGTFKITSSEIFFKDWQFKTIMFRQTGNVNFNGCSFKIYGRKMMF